MEALPVASWPLDDPVAASLVGMLGKKSSMQEVVVEAGEEEGGVMEASCVGLYSPLAGALLSSVVKPRREHVAGILFL